MKKLIIAALAVCAAVVTNAAAFTWSNSGGGPTAGKIYDSTSTLLTEGTIAYMFATDSLSQADFLAGIREADDASAYITSKAIAGSSASVNSSGRIAQTTTSFDYGSAGNQYNFYYAILKGDQVLISDIATAQGQASASENIGFSNSATWSKNAMADAEFNGAGWYTASLPDVPTPGPGGDVPEPTSGILMLVGLAGLALRRKA